MRGSASYRDGWTPIFALSEVAETNMREGLRCLLWNMDYPSRNSHS
jgi:hypothetical protein